MKAIYLSESAENLRYVFGPEQRARIAALLGEEPGEYTSVPEDGAGIEMIFSTWGMPRLTADEIHAKLPDLKAVFYAAGSVQYFARPFIECGVRVYSAWMANAVPVVQFAFAQILLACKGYFTVQALCRTNREAAHALFKNYPGIYDVKIGILGCGAIGSQVARRLAEEGLTVLAYDPYMSDERARELGVHKAGLDEIFRECIVISNHIPNLPSTVGVIRREHLLSMQEYATFINTGRGPQLCEQDLCDALNQVPTRTALLDVMTDEHLSDEKLIVRLPNCFITPHIAGSAGNEVRRMADYMAEMLGETIAGRQGKYLVTEKMLETMA